MKRAFRMNDSRFPATKERRLAASRQGPGRIQPGDSDAGDSSTVSHAESRNAPRRVDGNRAIGGSVESASEALDRQ